MAFFPTDTGGFFDGMNIFGAKMPTYLGGADGLLSTTEQEKLKNQALISGILGAGATYLAQPKNQGYGSALPYLAKSYLGGMTQSQGAYDQGTQNLLTQGKLAEFKREAETAKITKEAQATLMEDERVKNNPVLKALVAKGDYAKVSESLQPKATFGTGVEAATLNILAKGAGTSNEAIAHRSTPEYDLAYRNATSPKTIMQETQDANGNIYTVPVTIKPSPLPPSILPPTNWNQQNITQQSTNQQPTSQQPTGQQPITTKPTSQPPIIKKQAQTSQDIFKQQNDLRKDYIATPEIKNFGEVRSAYNIIDVALKNESPAGDLAAATKFMKILDPNSVVRETELAMAMSATGLTDRATNYFNLLTSGQKLTPEQRVDFRKVATDLYKAAEDVKIKYDTQYADIATKQNLDPTKVIMGYKAPQAGQNVTPDNRNAIFQKYGVKP